MGYIKLRDACIYAAYMHGAATPQGPGISLCHPVYVYTRDVYVDICNADVM